MPNFDIASFVIAQQEFAPQASNWVVEGLLPIIASVSLFIMIVLVVAIPVTVVHRYKRRVAELNAAVKQQMIERGYSVDEILTVIHEDENLLRSPRSSLGKNDPFQSSAGSGGIDSLFVRGLVGHATRAVGRAKLLLSLTMAVAVAASGSAGASPSLA